MKKLTIDKSDEIAEVIDRMIATSDSDVTLVIPKNSLLGKSASNFRLLKREAGLAEKLVTIESSDENVLAFAVANGLSGLEPGQQVSSSVGHQSPAAMRPRSNNSLSDIVAKNSSDDEDEKENEEEEEDVAPQPKKTPSPSMPIKLKVRTDQEEEQEKEDEKNFFDRDRFFKPRVISGDARDRDDDEDSRGGISGKAVAWIIGIIVVAAVAFYAVTIFFGHAQVTIDFTQTPWNYQSNFIADSVASSISGTTIPAQLFTTQKNITQLFPATGPSVGGGTKAQGTITVYNDYSSAPQDLVATTRFVTPSGQIFRLTTDITVPGATVSASGAITASSITAPIIADQAGPSYNVGPIAKLTIPGFQSNAGKYAGFYGSITGQTTGGSTGSHPTATAADIAGAKASTTAILQADLQDNLTASYPGNFKILDGATDIQITELIVSTSTDTNGNFSVFGEASLTAIGFDESLFKDYLLTVAEAASPSAAPSSTFKSVTLSYSNVQANFSKGQVSFALSAQGSLEPAFSASNFASSIAGGSITDARNEIQGLPQLSNGTISVWPVWLWDMPSDPNKIQVTVN